MQVIFDDIRCPMDVLKRHIICPDCVWDKNCTEHRLLTKFIDDISESIAGNIFFYESRRHKKIRALSKRALAGA